MGKNKLKHFNELLSFPNVIQKDNQYKGKWNELVFKNSNPITLELGCGKGEYSTGLAAMFPNQNFIGCDIKGARIYTGAKRAIENNLSNVRFLRMQIDHLPAYFEKDEIAEIWITFPDPYLPESDAKRRLTSPKFISVYKQVLITNGIINLKTDSTELYNYTLEVIKELKLNLIYHSDHIYHSDLIDERLNIKTYYEKKHLISGKAIKYVKFSIV